MDSAEASHPWAAFWRAILPAIRVPTLILHATKDATVDVRNARYTAEHIPGSKLVELPGADHLPWLANADAAFEEIAEFLTGIGPTAEPDRVQAGERWH